MTKSIKENRAQLLWGAFTADAAALGLHWIYAQPRVRRAGGDEPEFTEPDPANYEGVPSYFAHRGKKAGDLTMYGESALVMLRSIAETGSIDPYHFARSFYLHFGFGGEYVGYIDGPTRETLVNRIRHEEEFAREAAAIPYEGKTSKKNSIIGKVVSNGQLLRGEELREKVIEAVTLTKGGDAEIALANAVIDRYETNRRYPGSTEDAQLPAISRVAVLLAADPDLDGDSDRFEASIRMTHNNDQALSWARFTFDLMKALLQRPGDPAALEPAIQDLAANAPEYIATEIESVFKQRAQDNKVYTMKHGPACELQAGIPAALHNLLGAEDYRDAIRRNILASGDSCGRAMVLGPIAALLFSGDTDRGIPADWPSRLTRYEELSGLIETVLG